MLWDKHPLSMIWGVLLILCLIAGTIMFVMMKRIEGAVKD